MINLNRQKVFISLDSAYYFAGSLNRFSRITAQFPLDITMEEFSATEF
ncbi:MAG: hypothetical protein WC220_14825 [Pedobacter sp.]|jgi:hypothetical protein